MKPHVCHRQITSTATLACGWRLCNILLIGHSLWRWVKAGREDGETSAQHPVLQLLPDHAVNSTRFAIRRSSPHEFTIVRRPLAKPKPSLCNWLQRWRITLNQRVAGSSPATPTNKINMLRPLPSYMRTARGHPGAKRIRLISGVHSSLRHLPRTCACANNQSKGCGVCAHTHSPRSRRVRRPSRSASGRFRSGGMPVAKYAGSPTRGSIAPAE
jgi:hypothetical protein